MKTKKQKKREDSSVDAMSFNKKKPRKKNPIDNSLVFSPAYSARILNAPVGNITGSMGNISGMAESVDDKSIQTVYSLQYLMKELKNLSETEEEFNELTHKYLPVIKMLNAEPDKVVRVISEYDFSLLPDTEKYLEVADSKTGLHIALYHHNDMDFIEEVINGQQTYICMDKENALRLLRDCDIAIVER